MFRVINGCKRVLVIGDTRIKYSKWADFDDSYLYKLREFRLLIENGSVKVIYNISSEKTLGYELKKLDQTPRLEITEKDPKPETEEITETKSKSRRKKKVSEDEENNEN